MYGRCDGFMSESERVCAVCIVLKNVSSSRMRTGAVLRSAVDTQNTVTDVTSSKNLQR